MGPAARQQQQQQQQARLRSATAAATATLFLLSLLVCDATTPADFSNHATMDASITPGAGRLLRRGGKKATAAAAASPGDGSIKLESCFEAGLTADFPRESFPFCQILAEGQAALYWSNGNYYSGNNEAATTAITLALVLRGEGVGRPGSWMALGVTPESKGMRGVDMGFLRWLHEHEQQQQHGGGPVFVFEDRFSRDYEPPTVDAQQDKTLLLAKTYPAAKTAAMVFTMPISHCNDEKEDMPILPGREMFVLWAHGDLDEDGEPNKHQPGDKGGVRVPLLASKEAYALTHGGLGEEADGGAGPMLQDKKPAARKGPSATETFVPAPALRLAVTIPTMEVPEEPTKYVCMYQLAPQDQKYHVYDFKLLGGEELTHRFVHHAGLYLAGDAVPRHKLNQPFDCTMTPNEGLPLTVNDRGEWSTPPPRAYESVDAAFPFGKGYDKYWMLEVHFSNPDGAKGVTAKGLGIEVIYSPTLRKQDVGVLVTGAPGTAPDLNFTSSLQIPPGLKAWDYLNYCPGNCLGKHLPAPEGTQTQTHLLHAHIHAHTMATGLEIQMLHKNADESFTRTRLLNRNYWDVENQNGVTFMAPGVKYLPGDSFLTRCTYDSSARTAVTGYGPSRNDEMCQSMVFYYPAKLNTLLCFDYENSHAPGVDLLRKLGKLHHAQCQTGHDFANMTTNIELRDQISLNGGMVPLPDEETAAAKAGWDDPALQLCPAA